MRNSISRLVAGTALVLAYSIGTAFGAEAPPSGIPFHPSQMTPGKQPIPPGHGPHAHTRHGKKVAAAVAKHAADGCDHLAHHFVGTVSHAQFMRECHTLIHNTITHVPPHPDSEKN